MASGIPESAIEEIKARTDLADLVEGYGIQVKRAGGAYKACCPFHHEKTPSFHIQPEKGFFHCFGCGVSGDAISFVMKYEGLPFCDAVKKLASAAGIEIEMKEDPEAGIRKRLLAMHAELAAFYRRCLERTREAERARRYLESRDISGEVAERFQIGYAPLSADAMLAWAEKHRFTPEELDAAGVLRPPRNPGGRSYSPFSGRLMFAIRDRQGRVIAFSGRTLETDKARMRGGKYVNSPATPIFRKSGVLYAFDIAAGRIANAKPVREAIVCEGQIDVVRCHACGFDTAVASQGTAFTAEHVQMLKKVADAAVLVFDGDAAGRKATLGTAGDMLEAGMTVRVARLPPGEDPDSFLRSRGAAAFREKLDKAVSIVRFIVDCARETEQTPDSYDAISRTGRTVLELVRRAPGAVMRAGLMQEAATLLRIPVAALEEDLARVKPDAIRSGKATPVAPLAPDRLPAESAGISEDAASPENNPPPPVELAFMEFLHCTARSGQIADILAAYAPDALFLHEVTAAFVKAVVRETAGESDAIVNLVRELPAASAGVLEGVFCADGRDNASELSPVENLVNYLRRLWAEAVDRRLLSMPISGDGDHDALRIRLRLVAKKFRDSRRYSWDAVRALMTPDLLGGEAE